MRFSIYLAVFFKFKSWQTRFAKHKWVWRLVKCQCWLMYKQKEGKQILNLIHEYELNGCMNNGCIHIQMTIPMIGQQECRNTRMDGRCDPKIEESLSLTLRTGSQFWNRFTVLEREVNPGKKTGLWWLSKVYITWQQPLAISDRQNYLQKHIIGFYLYCNSGLPLCNSDCSTAKEKQRFTHASKIITNPECH